MILALDQCSKIHPKVAMLNDDVTLAAATLGTDGIATTDTTFFARNLLNLTEEILHQNLELITSFHVIYEKMSKNRSYYFDIESYGLTWTSPSPLRHQYLPLAHMVRA